MKGMKCVKCGETAKEARLSFQGHQIDGWKCRCGEEYFDPEQAEKILMLNRIRNKKFRVKLGRMRSNLIIRMPKELERTLGLEKGGEMILQATARKKIEMTA